MFFDCVRVLPVEVYMYIEIKYIKIDKTKKEDRVNGVKDFLSLPFWKVKKINNLEYTPVRQGCILLLLE